MLSRAFIFKQAVIVGTKFSSAIFGGRGGGGWLKKGKYISSELDGVSKNEKVLTDFQILFPLPSWK